MVSSAVSPSTRVGMAGKLYSTEQPRGSHMIRFPARSSLEHGRYLLARRLPYHGPGVVSRGGSHETIGPLHGCGVPRGSARRAGRLPHGAYGSGACAARAPLRPGSPANAARAGLSAGPGRRGRGAEDEGCAGEVSAIRADPRQDPALVVELPRGDGILQEGGRGSRVHAAEHVADVLAPVPLPEAEGECGRATAGEHAHRAVGWPEAVLDVEGLPGTPLLVFAEGHAVVRVVLAERADAGQARDRAALEDL